MLALLVDSVLHWELPGLYLCGLLTPPVFVASFRAALLANCFRGAFPPVDFRAVCLVRAMSDLN